MKYVVRLVLAFIMGFIIRMPVVAADGPQTLDIDNLPEWRMTTSSDSCKLLLSDSPEMAADEGILYQDEVKGNVRLFFYHVNAAATAKRMAVVLENSGPETAHVTVRQYGLGGPGYIWMEVGKEAMTAYLHGSAPYQLAVPPRSGVPLSADISNTAVLPNMLLNGIFDFATDRPVTVKVIMMPLFADSVDFARQAKVLPSDEYHLRGTFEGANRRLVPIRTYDTVLDGVMGLTLADNLIDPYLKGIDATDGSPVVDYGNYGVVYRIFLPSQGRKIAYYLTPLGGDYAGAIKIKYGNTDRGPVATPPGRISFGDNEYALLGTFDSNNSLWLTFSPPGASNLPVKLIIMPQ
ncbi:Hypothetical protein LUCI_1134 [Lucifera butyrica]|uniref:Uncharacterized protein n=1 Tax=Lucifera butyrica TaxID=1351585 RepID=A0A498R6Y1_9FIRM|nr:hypothetical protein [Lucifera butyrica]VBB05923.1 Hypothetical protein LUCI_1134 [Lucifera butyrica]